MHSLADFQKSAALAIIRPIAACVWPPAFPLSGAANARGQSRNPQRFPLGLYPQPRTACAGFDPNAADQYFPNFAHPSADEAVFEAYSEVNP